MVGISPSAIQQQCAQARVRIDGLKNGLKSVGWRWIPGKTSGIKKGAFAPFSMTYKPQWNSKELCRSKFGAGNEARTRGYGYYILPTYPSDLAAIQFDRSGTTRIGRFVINHSFILPGLIGVSVSCVFGWILAAAFGFL